MPSAGRWITAAVPALVLLASAVAQAKPADAVHSAAQSAANVRSIGSLPQQALAGEAFTLAARIRNNSGDAARPRLVVTLRKLKHAKAGRVVADERLSRLKAGRSKRYQLEIELPDNLAAGRYYATVCARERGGPADCVLAGRLRVTRPTTLRSPGNQTGAPGALGTPGTLVTPGAAGQPSGNPYDVLVLTETDGASHASTAAGVAAIKAMGVREGFGVTEAARSGGAFTEASLDTYRTVVFLNTTGDVLSDNEQSAFEHFFKHGGGFVGIHGAIGAEPGWPLMNSLLGTRAETGTGTIARESVQEAATIRVADRVHDASKSLPERFDVQDSFYNTTSDVRGLQHVLATVDEDTYAEQDATPTRADDHPLTWCQDFEGGRAFYTGLGHNPTTFSNANVREHLAGAIKWSAGESDPVYSDCGATVLANYKQTKISAPPNLDEPIGFDQLPDGRIIQTARAGQVRLHDLTGGTTTTLANLANTTAFPKGLYTQSEDGLYGPAVDNDFAQNKWVYLYYSPATVTSIRQSNGSTLPGPFTTPLTNAPTTAASLNAWDPYVGYFQLSRFKFVEATAGEPAHLDPASEQEILRVPVNRGACCHVAGDIDFDRNNNLWLVTGDDTPAGGGNSGGFGPFNDMKTNESQTVRVTNATGGTFTLTFEGQTTAPIAFNATAATVQAALEALSNIELGDILATGGPVQNANVTVNFRGGGHKQRDVTELTSNASALTGTTPTITHATTQQGDWFTAPFVDARRSSLNTNDLRGKVLRFKVADNGSYTVPAGNLFPRGTAGTRSEIYAMGFRNPFRIQVDNDNVAYVTDYSSDANAPQDFRGPAGTGRVEVVRKPANYGWPICMTPDLPMFKWDFNTSTPLPSMANPEPWECDNPGGVANTSRWNSGQQVDGTVQSGLPLVPPLTQPDIWYSYNDNRANDPLGTPCFGSYDNDDPNDRCPLLFPELFTGGVGPHGATAYQYDPDNPSTTKFPPYYDGAMILGEFTQNTLREVRFDSANKVLEINPFLNCGEALSNTGLPFECDNPMDLQFGADGNFYLLTYGDGFFAANADAGMYRWEYKKGPEAPRAVIAATPTNGTAPLAVQFSSAGSGDDDPGDSITFAWDFNNGGTVDSTDPNPSFTYTANGVYTAKLTVSDSTGQTDSKSTVITVGNTAPTVTINTPIDGDFFAFGDNIPWSVTVTDPQDGPVDTPAECARVTVTFVLVHDQHGHAETQQTGCSGVMPTDASLASHGGYLAGGMSVSYTDNAQGSVPALTTSAQHIVQLRRHELENTLEQSGVFFANGDGGRVTSNIDPGDWVVLNNRINLTNMNKEITFRYAGGAAGSVAGVTPRMAVEIRQGSPTGTLLGTVTLTATGTNNNTYTSQTAPLNFAGSQRLYLVFQSVAGGPTATMGNVNWVEFTGPGAGVNP